MEAGVGAGLPQVGQGGFTVAAGRHGVEVFLDPDTGNTV